MAEKAILSYFLYNSHNRTNPFLYNRFFPDYLLSGLQIKEAMKNVRVGFGMDPDEKLNKANCLQPAKV